MWAGCIWFIFCVEHCPRELSSIASLWPNPQDIWLLESPVPAVSAHCPLVSGGPSAWWTFLGMPVAVSGHTQPCGAEQPSVLCQNVQRGSIPELGTPRWGAKAGLCWGDA